MTRVPAATSLESIAFTRSRRSDSPSSAKKTLSLRAVLMRPLTLSSLGTILLLKSSKAMLAALSP